MAVWQTAAWAAVAMAAAAAVVSDAGGCAAAAPAATSQPADPTDAALRDPMNYKPPFEAGRPGGNDASGFDSGGFKRDMNDVLNP